MFFNVSRWTSLVTCRVRFRNFLSLLFCLQCLAVFLTIPFMPETTRFAPGIRGGEGWHQRKPKSRPMASWASEALDAWDRNSLTWRSFSCIAILTSLTNIPLSSSSSRTYHYLHQRHDHTPIYIQHSQRTTIYIQHSQPTTIYIQNSQRITIYIPRLQRTAL